MYLDKINIKRNKIKPEIKIKLQVSQNILDQVRIIKIEVFKTFKKIKTLKMSDKK